MKPEISPSSRQIPGCRTSGHRLRGQCWDGFTLIELLAVIAIIGVLAAITLVTVGKVRSAAQSARCMANLKSIGTALLTYATDNKNMLPPAANLPNSPVPAVNYTGPLFRQKTFWFDALNPYMGHPAWAADRATNFPEPTDTGSGLPFPWQQCPSKTYTPLMRANVGYGWNACNFGWDGSKATSFGYAIRLDQVETPSRTIIAGDSKDPDFMPDQYAFDRYIYDYDHETRYPYPKRHNGGGNYVFLDGHVQRIAAERMSTREVIDLFKKTK
ncbi:prepilin-type N-terminal cleavage/methylation domain-containing protein [Opitutaceae bacterium TAV1]|nr:N-terminal cleavage protein [Opitutaceae bacterium TAV5]EIQ00516.1 prepilin-type N-terminal cleavage/methylation domain-containing protein [Opitutaceae bacterium TAV1]